MNHAYAYLVLRFATGVNFLVHALKRIFDEGGWIGWANRMGGSFAETPLIPVWGAKLFGYVISPVEFIVGILLIFGLFTRWAALAGGLLMAGLCFGMGMKGEWNTIAMQMIYVLLFFFLLERLEHNRISLDKLIFGEKSLKG